MSQETAQWLNTMTLQGFTEKRGHAWHYQAGAQGDESNHYPFAIPAADVERRLFCWEPVEGKIKTQFRAGGRSQTVDVPSLKSWVHPDTGDVLGVVGKGAAAHSYKKWLIDNFKTVLDSDELGIGSAGLLKKGAQAWVQIELPETIQGPGGIAHRPYLTGSAVFDGSRSTVYGTGSVLAVCDNTLSAALSGLHQQVKYRHSQGVEMKPQDVRDALNILFDSADAINAELDSLLQIDVSDQAWERFVKLHLGKDRPFDKGRAQTNWDNAHDTLTTLYRDDPMVAPWTGTGFGVVQAVNTYRHHHQVVKNVTRGERNMLSRIDGTNDKQDALVLSQLQAVLAA